MRDAVSNAMRMLSEEPLTLGVPVHCATEGIASRSYPRAWMLSREAQKLGQRGVSHRASIGHELGEQRYQRSVDSLH
jgi:hypothetical protein